MTTELWSQQISGCASNVTSAQWLRIGCAQKLWGGYMCAPLHVAYEHLFEESSWQTLCESTQ